MSVASMSPGDLSGSHVKIGAPSHLSRNLLFLAGAMVLGAGVFLFYRQSATADAARLAKLDSFRFAYAEKCDAPAWRTEAASAMRDAYLSSTTMQAVVDREAEQLASGVACEDIAKALKTADFPIPAAAK